MWFALALTAALCWGLSYALSEYILKTQMTVPVYMLITSLVSTVVSLGLVAFSASGRQGWAQLVQQPAAAVGPSLNALLYCLGSVLVYSAIQRANATSVGFVEITYPFFTAFFAFWLFGAAQMTTSTLLGGVCIMVGLVFIAQGHS